MFWFVTFWVGLAWSMDANTLVRELETWKAQRTSGTAPNIPTTEYQEALKGEIITGIEVVPETKAAKGYGLVALDIPIEQLWRAIADEDHHAGVLPIAHSKTIDGTPRTHDHTVFQYMHVPLLTDRWWLTRIRYNNALYVSSKGRAWELWWTDRIQDKALYPRLDQKLIADGMPIAWSKGAWLLVDLGNGRTLIEYHTWSDPGGRVPVGPATRFAAGEVKSNLMQIAAFAKSHTPTCAGTYQRPDGQPM